MEIWKDIPGFEGLYQASNFGNIRGLDREVPYKNTPYTKFQKGILLKPKVGTHNYLEVVLMKHGERHCCRVHKLIALTFIPNPENLPIINHIDENKSNNRVDNLEWCNFSYNTEYSKKAIHIKQYDLKGNLVGEYSHYSEAGRNVGGNRFGVFKCCKGKLKTYKGFIWKAE